MINTTSTDQSISKILYMMDPVVPMEVYNSTGSTNLGVQLALSMKDKSEVTIAGNWSSANTTDLREFSGVSTIDLGTTKRTYMKHAFSVIHDHLLETKYDIIHIHISTPSVARYINRLITHLDSSGMSDVDVIFTMHSWPGTSAVSYHYKSDYSELYSSRCKFVFIAPSQKSTFEDIMDSSGRGYIIPNGIKIDNDDYDELEVLLKHLPSHWNSGDYYIMVNRITPSKNVLFAMDAVIQRGGNLLIVGSPWINDDKDYYNEFLSKIDSNDNIINIQEVRNSEVLVLMKHSKALLITSNLEVCNLVALESALVGTPVVGHTVTGLQDTMNDLSEGGSIGVSYPYRSRYNTRLTIFKEAMDSVDGVRYDKSKYPNKYKFESMISSYMDLYYGTN